MAAQQRQLLEAGALCLALAHTRDSDSEYSDSDEEELANAPTFIPAIALLILACLPKASDHGAYKRFSIFKI